MPSILQCYWYLPLVLLQIQFCGLLKYISLPNPTYTKPSLAHTSKKYIACFLYLALVFFIFLAPLIFSICLIPSKTIFFLLCNWKEGDSLSSKILEFLTSHMEQDTTKGKALNYLKVLLSNYSFIYSSSDPSFQLPSNSRWNSTPPPCNHIEPTNDQYPQHLFTQLAGGRPLSCSFLMNIQCQHFYSD